MFAVNGSIINLSDLTTGINNFDKNFSFSLKAEEAMHSNKINISEMNGFRIGNASDYQGMTGVTAILLDAPNTAGIDISGGGPAARESALLFPSTSANPLNAIVLSGGSAFGLEASTGVMRYLRERKAGYHILKYQVPLVCQSCIFDLGIGKEGIYPDAHMGYMACIDAEKNRPSSGIIGAGTGASAGKFYGIRRGTKTGIGYSAVQVGELQIGAVAVVNAYGDVRDPYTGQIIAGLMDPGRTEFISTEKEILRTLDPASKTDPGNRPQAASSSEAPERANTTLAVILTNASFSKADINRIAGMARAAFGRCISPSGTPVDGDTIYAVSLQPGIQADLLKAGAIAASVLSDAIADAVRSSSMPDAEFLNCINIV